MLKVVILNIFLLLFGIVEGIYRVHKSKFIFNKNYSERNLKKLYRKVVIVVPVYNEQNVIRKSMLNFIKIINYGIDVIYVATSKETAQVTTYSMLKELIEEYKIKDHCKVLLYPKKDGVMAHQLNYAINQIDNDKIVIVYNVDSVVDIKTINYILINKDKLKNGVFQQYSYSTYETKNRFIESAIRWQNRWAIAYELPRTINNFKFRIKKFNYVIGHGLALSKEIYNRIGGFSEDEINEDNVLGYRLSMEKINIFPLPLLEKIDFAQNLKIYINQQSVWFNGPLYAFKYFFKMKKGCNSKRTFNLFFMACQNFKNALNWMVFPYLTVFSIIYTIFVKKISILLLLILLLLGYVVGINSLSERLLIKTGYLVKKSKFNITHLLVEIIFWLFIHSFGPIITIYKIIKGTNNQKNKYKTEKI